MGLHGRRPSLKPRKRIPHLILYNLRAENNVFMFKVFYLSRLMTSHRGLLVFDSGSQDGELSYNFTFKGGPSRYMIGNFLHNLHVINSGIDTVEEVQMLSSILVHQRNPMSCTRFRTRSLF